MLSPFYRQGKETQRDLVMPKVTQLLHHGGRAGLLPKAGELLHGCEFRRQKLKEFLPDKTYFVSKLEGKDRLRMKVGYKFMIQTLDNC